MTAAPGPIEELVLNGVPVRVARPAEPHRTGVVVLHQGPGYALQTEQWLQRLAGDGHLAVAPLFLHHRGEVAVNPFERFGGDLSAFAAFLPDDREIRGDISVALQFIRDAGVDPLRTAVIGFSYGGRAAFLAATENELGAAITFYGNGIQNDGYAGNAGIPPLVDRVGKLKTAWLGLYGEEDFLLAPGEIDQLEESLQAAPVSAALVRYPGAGHAFDADMVFAPGTPSSLSPDAADDAIERTREFLRTRLRDNSPGVRAQGRDRASAAAESREGSAT